MRSHLSSGMEKILTYWYHKSLWKYVSQSGAQQGGAWSTAMASDGSSWGHLCVRGCHIVKLFLYPPPQSLTPGGALVSPPWRMMVSQSYNKKKKKKKTRFREEYELHTVAALESYGRPVASALGRLLNYYYYLLFLLLVCLIGTGFS